MANETSISRQPDRNDLGNALAQIYQEWRVIALQASITGARWSFSGGERMPDQPLSPPRRIQLSEHTGVIIYGWEELKPESQTEIESLLRSIRL